MSITAAASQTRMLCLVLALACLAPDGSQAGAATTPTAGRATPGIATQATTPPAGQPTATLERSHHAFSRPSARATTLGRIADHRPITAVRTVLPVLRDTTDATGHRWLRVLLPGRPNGRTGWIRERGTTPGRSPWAIEVQRGRRRVLVRHEGVLVRTFRAIVGAPATPTPTGRFFVEEAVRIPAGGVSGPYALATSARSTVLQEFDGGPGQIALHGRDGLGGTLGTAVSHGCVRLGSAPIRWLAARIGPGDRVTIRR